MARTGTSDFGRSRDRTDAHGRQHEVQLGSVLLLLGFNQTDSGETVQVWGRPEDEEEKSAVTWSYERTGWAVARYRTVIDRPWNPAPITIDASLTFLSGNDGRAKAMVTTGTLETDVAKTCQTIMSGFFNLKGPPTDWQLYDPSEAPATEGE